MQEPTTGAVIQQISDSKSIRTSSHKSKTKPAPWLCCIRRVSKQNIVEEGVGVFGDGVGASLLTAVSCPLSEVFGHGLDEVGRRHEDGESADDGEEREGHQA